MSRLQETLDRGWPAIALAAVALGLAAANWIAFPRLAGIAASAAAVGAVFRLPPKLRLALVAIALGGLGLWWGGLRLHELDRSYLATRVGDPAGATVVVTGAAGVSPYAVRVQADVRRFDGVELRERVLLELPAGRAPPQGAVLDLRARPVAPRGPETGFDERGWLERRGIHVVLHASGPWHVVGRRGGIGGVGDRLRTEIGNALSLGTTGERRSLVIGVVLGADQGIDPELRAAFKASGLYHLLAVSGQNIVLIGFGVLGLAYVVGLGRAVGHTLAIVAILAYALAVGWQPSVVRAAVAGCSRIARVAAVPAERPVAHDGDGGGGAARVDAALAARAGIPALVRSGGRDLPHAAAAAPAARGLPGACSARRGRRDLCRLRHRDRTDPVAAVRDDPALDRACERTRRAGDADPARLRARGCGACAGGSSGGRGALVDRRSRSCLDRVLGAPDRIAAVCPDVIPHGRSRRRGTCCGPSWR